MDSTADPMLGFLLDMGFPLEKAQKALSSTGHSSVESAMEWILSHGDDDTTGGENTTEQSAAESATMKLPLTDEELEEQARKLEERRKQRRAEKAEEERKLELEREKSRRLTGQEILQAKEKAREVEMKKYAEERKREKDEDKKAKERIKALIEEDRRNRENPNQPPSDVPPVPPTPFSSPVSSSVNLDATAQTRIQIRMFDGRPLTQTFGVHEPLGAVRLYAELNRKDGEMGPFGLMTNFPKREFSDEDMSAPLSALGLVPSATLIATRKSLV